MQLSNTPGKLLLPFAADGAKNAIPVDSQIGIVAGKASLSDGFPPLTRTPLSAGGVPPSGLDMNGILYEMSAIVRWANAGGGYAYDATFATDINVGGYPKGARIMRTDGTGYWFNTVENNVTDPESAGAAAAGWVPDFTTGAATVAMASSSVTLTPAQYGKPLIVITGTLTANLNLVFPNIVGNWVIINSTTGNFTITAKTAAGVGVTLGTVTPITGDSVNIYTMASDAISFTQSGVGAVARTVADELREQFSVSQFGAKFDGTDESSAAIAALAAHNVIYVPEGKTLIAKNIELSDNSRVIVEGALKLPSACADFDRLLYGDSLSDVNIAINELNGNYAGQVGNIGTHLIYLTNCVSPSVNLRNTHDHYVASGAATPSVDGIRNTSTGAIFLYQCSKADVNVRLLEGWGREGIYLLNCTKSEVTVGHCQGKYLTEYSGVQVSGVNNSINRASVDFAGASAVGFDTSYGFLSNVIATNTRENSGVNFGHTGYPATGSVAENIVVDGSFGAGISVLSSSQDLTINNFSVQNTGESGIQFSDGVIGGKLSNGAVSYPARWNLVAGAVAEIQTSNVKSSVRDAATLLVNVTAGAFAAGETVTSIGGSAQVRKALQNLTGSQQRLFFVSNVPASYVVGDSITGSGGAVGTIAGVYVPTEYNEDAGGKFIRDPRYFPGTGNQIRFPDGTAIYTWNLACAYTGSGAIQTFTQNFLSNTIWASAPYVTATVSSHSSTSGFVINYLEANATTAAASIMINATVNQTYGVNIMAVGRWK